VKAAFFDSPGRVSVRDVPEPSCPPGGLLASVRACAICGSDLRTMTSGPADPSTVYGHECVLEVLEVDRDVRSYSPGDRIIVCPVTCGTCDMCLRGAYHLCRRKEQVRTTNQGGFAGLVQVGSEAIEGGFILKIPDTLGDLEATIVEPLACVLSGSEKTSTGPGKTVAILGAGTVGNLHMQVARMKGSRCLIMIDLLRSRLDANASFGPVALVDASTCDPVETVREMTEHRGAGIVIVACVSARAQAQAIQMADKQGEVLFFAALPAGSPDATINTNLIHYSELKIIGARSASRRYFDLALELIAEGRVNVTPLVTHVLPLDEIARGFELMKSGAAMRVVLVP